MNSTKSYILSISIAVLAVCYVMSALFDLNTLKAFSRGVIFPLFVVLYFLQPKKKNVFFAGFLILFSISEIISAFDPGGSFAIYYTCNLTYILSYLSLATYFMLRMNFLILLSRFKAFILVLLVVNTYIVYILNMMILKDTAYYFWTLEFFIEFTYNLSILLLLTLSLLSYLYHDSKEDLLLFLATACIVFSEMIYVTTLYTADNYMFGILYTIFFTAGFSLVYTYIVSKMNTYYRVLF